MKQELYVTSICKEEKAVRSYDRLPHSNLWEAEKQAFSRAFGCLLCFTAVEEQSGQLGATRMYEARNFNSPERLSIRRSGVLTLRVQEGPVSWPWME